MSGRADRTNRELRALDRAYRHGQFDRAGYRARRRDLLSALRVRDEITARNAIVPATGRGGGAASREGRDSASSILFDSRSQVPRRLLYALLAGIAAAAVAFIWFAGGDAHVR